MEHFKIKIGNSEFNSELNSEQMREILRTIYNGGVCLIPSDTGYSLATIPHKTLNIDNLRNLLPHALNAPISLCFASRDMARKYVLFSAKDERSFDSFRFAPITLVCPLINGKVKTRLAPVINTLNTLGVRISDSVIERQISQKLDRPITTCAVRNADGNIIRNFDEAIEVLKERMRSIGKIIPLAAIKSPRIKYEKDSTIISFIDSQVKILREGVIDPQDIIREAKSITMFDIEDWT